MIMPDACSLPHGSGHSRRNWVVVRTGPRVLARTEIITHAIGTTQGGPGAQWQRAKLGLIR